MKKNLLKNNGVLPLSAARLSGKKVYAEAFRKDPRLVPAANEELTCTVLNGPFAGQSLWQVYRENRRLFGYDKYEEFPLLIGFVDANDNLSIQIHPGDEYARTVEGKPFGKNESWLFLKAPREGAIINGCKCTSLEEVHKLIDENRWDDIIDRLPVKQNEEI